MWSGILRELRYLSTHKWDLSMVTVVPLLIIVMMSAMFYSGKAEHLPIALIDQDQSQLSRNVEKYLSQNQSLKIDLVTRNIDEAEQWLNQNKVWGYVHIPSGAEQRLVQAKDAGISVAYNQSYFSVGNIISSAMSMSVVQAISDYLGEEYLAESIPYADVSTPNVKISVLYNPGMSYEFYLELFAIPAILHLLLGCCVAFSIGQEFKFNKAQHWLEHYGIFTALSSKILVYVFIFSLWTWLWMFWLIEYRDWFIAGHLWLIILAQFIFYAAYGFMAAMTVLIIKDLAESFGVIAIYGGSSLSFAGVTLPVNNASVFTRSWSDLIPYTTYAKLQTQQWVMGSSISTSLPMLLILIIFCSVFATICLVMLHRYKKGATA